jgi:histidine ammonia-lyase
MKITVGDNHLALADLIALGSLDTQIELTAAAVKRIAESRKIADEHLDGASAVYGLNVGLGANVSMKLERGSTADFERSVIEGRMIGIGEPLPDSVSRRALGIRITNLCNGNSAVSPHVVEQLVEMYNKGLTPVVASLGSVGSSDLGQCAQLCAAALGIGDVSFRGTRVSAFSALSAANLQPVELAAKDALGLLNSGSVTQSAAVEVIAELGVVLAAAKLVAVASCEAYGVNPGPFLPEVVATKSVPGGDDASRLIMDLLHGSWTLEEGAIDQAQHALSFRTLVPLVALVETHARSFMDLLQQECNSSNDNPVVLLEKRQIRSSSNFQSLAVSVAGDALSIALTHWSNATANRTIRMANGTIEGVPRYLAPLEGHSVGFNALMKSTVAMATRVRFEANPASLDFFAISENAEDVASQFPLVVEKLGRQIGWLRQLVAIEAVTAHQLLCLRAEVKRGKAAKRVIDVVGKYVPLIDHDQPLGHFVNAVSNSIARGELA